MCSRLRHIAKDCHTFQYFVTVYEELEKFRKEKKEAHTLDAPFSSDLNIKNYMVYISKEFTLSDVALIDSATTYTILRDPKYFTFSGHRAAWQNYNIIIIAGSWNFRFREGQATIVLSGGTPL